MRSHAAGDQTTGEVSAALLFLFWTAQNRKILDQPWSVFMPGWLGSKGW